MTLKEAQQRVTQLLAMGKTWHEKHLTFGQITEELSDHWDLAFDLGYNTKQNDLDKVYARLQYWIEEVCQCEQCSHPDPLRADALPRCKDGICLK